MRFWPVFVVIFFLAEILFFLGATGAALFRLLLLSVCLIGPFWFIGRLGVFPRSWLKSIASAFDELTFFVLGSRKRKVFLVCAFSMLAKLAKADGHISAEEITRVERYMKEELELSEGQRRRVIEIFRQAKDWGQPFIFYAREFYETFSRQPELLGHMIEILLDLAAADEELNEEEDRLIRTAAILFGFKEARYEALRSRYVSSASAGSRTEDRQSGNRGRTEGRAEGRPGSALESCYIVLGCTRSSSDDEIKRAYRKLALEHHPDRVRARGLPDEFKKIANRKFQQIQEAYNTVREARGIK